MSQIQMRSKVKVVGWYGGIFLPFPFFFFLFFFSLPCLLAIGELGEPGREIWTVGWARKRGRHTLR
ncbi:hypothetical protein LX36DRAFT_350099 [Colletotrichum falcatum]|nr:hypothetical protein LX36DRAFT_350099 [Colletotrichum falcatum]